MPAFQPYWGKPAVRNDREVRGNVGIIRSPIRASIPPDLPGIRAPGSLVLVPSKGTARDLSALQKTVGVRGPMSRSDDYRRFAAECMKAARPSASSASFAQTTSICSNIFRCSSVLANWPKRRHSSPPRICGIVSMAPYKRNRLFSCNVPEK